VFEGFESTRIDAGGAEINLRHGGSGPPVLLLHGYPQTHAMWHAVAPRLAERFSVVAPDLRGYGDSSKPPGGADHAGYSKRAMARDQVEAMRALGFERFAVVGHDRGARVGHRMALDHPERVTRLAVLDIVATHTVFATLTSELATAYYHWFFLIQPHDLPERMIGADPSFYLRAKLSAWSGSGGCDWVAPEAMSEYERCFRDPATIHASCEDYRAGASIDLAHDEADIDARVTCPVLALWGEHGRIAGLYDVLDTWREKAVEVSGRGLPCGHFLAEQLVEETAAELLGFLGD